MTHLDMQQRQGVLFSGIVLLTFCTVLQKSICLANEWKLPFEAIKICNNNNESSSFEECSVKQELKYGSNSSLTRHKRQAFSFSCPNRPAPTRSRASTSSPVFLTLYSPTTNRNGDLRIAYGTKGWRQDDIKKLLKMGLDLSKPTLIYTHGYTQNIRYQWLMNVRRRYNEIQMASGSQTKSAPFNLLFFDWSNYGRRPYGNSVSYVPYLGKVLSEFLEVLSNRHKYDMNQVHIVSYSLSTHIAGQTGRQMQAKKKPIGQITAVDPTGVCFHMNSNFANKYSLKPTDAKLVVAKHYDMNSLGAGWPIGGVDVFVNGGRHQPPMNSVGISLNILEMVTSPGGSSHSRAAEHESTSATTGDDSCHEVAYACRSYEAFLAGECADCGVQGNKCYLMNTMTNVMRFAARKASNGAAGSPSSATPNYKPGTKMFIKTGRERFCLHHYQVVVQLANDTSTVVRNWFKSRSTSFLMGGAVLATTGHPIGSHRFSALLTLNRRLEPSELNLPLGISLEGGSSSSSSSSNNNNNNNNNNGYDIQDNLYYDILASIKQLNINYMSHVGPEERSKASARYCPKLDDGILIRC